MNIFHVNIRRGALCVLFRRWANGLPSVVLHLAIMVFDWQDSIDFCHKHNSLGALSAYEIVFEQKYLVTSLSLPNNEQMDFQISGTMRLSACNFRRMHVTLLVYAMHQSGERKIIHTNAHGFIFCVTDPIAIYCSFQRLFVILRGFSVVVEMWLLLLCLFFFAKAIVFYAPAFLCKVSIHGRARFWSMREGVTDVHLLSVDDTLLSHTVYPKKYAHGFVVLCFVVVMQSFIMNSHEVFIHIHQGCFAGTGAIVRLPQCQWSKPDGYGKISQFITTTKHSKAKTVCIFLWIYCRWALVQCPCVPEWMAHVRLHVLVIRKYYRCDLRNL